MEILTSAAHSVRTTLADWRKVLRASWRDLPSLCEELQLSAVVERGLARELNRSERASLAGQTARSNGEVFESVRRFPVFAPARWISKIEHGNWRDPLLLQILPTMEESVENPAYVTDPVGDAAATRSGGLLQKYNGRALLVLTGACGIHCRYCFRRHFPYGETPLVGQRWEHARETIHSDPSIREIILSGGDPLTWSDKRLERIVSELAAIPHLKRLRIHSRMPVVIPERVTDSLIPMLSGDKLQTVLVIHANHPRELDQDVEDSLRRLATSGVLLFNQAVLLRGVNDSAEVLIGLSERLIECRTTPYYLHQLDRVSGATHFEVNPRRGMQLMQFLRDSLPGYAVPRYVREVAGGSAKEPVLVTEEDARTPGFPRDGI